METVMANKARNTSGKFAPKSETPRKIRSVNLTDEAWQWLADVAAQSGVSRNDYLEAMAEGGTPFIETADSKISPLMETVETETEVNSPNTAQQPDSEIYPLMETANLNWRKSDFAIIEQLKKDKESIRKEFRQEINSRKKLEADYAALLESSTAVTKKLREELAKLRSQLETERADREEIEAQLSELKQNSAPAARLSENLIPDAATMLSKLRAKRKKSKVELADVEVLLELLDES